MPQFGETHLGDHKKTDSKISTAIFNEVIKVYIPEPNSKSPELKICTHRKRFHLIPNERDAKTHLITP
ncbi:MAG: hypothetical protein QRY74_04340 [Chlamydia sp.]